ncbi:MAG: YidC/Oxa1 family membrane protein insertase [Egibacteraceae bacterium]
MGALWNGLVDGLADFLRLLHTATQGVFGDFAWGWAIILLTFSVRLVLLPLAIKQTNSMRAMMRVQPELKKIQARYKVDRSMSKTNPDKYRERKQKQQEAMMALYKEHKVNPLGSCLPLILQAPILFALYRVLLSEVPEVREAPFYLIGSLGATVREGLAVAGIGVFLLLIVMAVTQFVTQKQMMSRQPSSSPEQAQQQKIMLYAMPAMITIFGFNLPAGVLLYWVAQNVWMMVQQYVMFRSIEPLAAGSGKS